MLSRSYEFQAFIIASTATEEEMLKWYASFNSYCYLSLSHSVCVCVCILTNMLLIFQRHLVFVSCSRYNEHVVWGDKDLKIKLLRKGILTRIYSPTVSDKLSGMSKNRNEVNYSKLHN